MALFLSTYVNKVDKKGRVSVPARFRAVLAGPGFNGVVLFPSFVSPAIEGCGMEFMLSLSRSIGAFDPFSTRYDDFADAILPEAHELPFDSEGRILLPEPLIAHAGLSDMAAFVGRGERFQIWEPEAFKARRAEARSRAREQRDALRRAPAPAGEEAGT